MKINLSLIYFLMVVVGVFFMFYIFCILYVLYNVYLCLLQMKGVYINIDFEVQYGYIIVEDIKYVLYRCFVLLSLIMNLENQDLFYINDS